MTTDWFNEYLKEQQKVESLNREIEKLRDEVKRYKPVLLQIINHFPEEGDVEDYWYCRAREALLMKDGE